MLQRKSFRALPAIVTGITVPLFVPGVDFASPKVLNVTPCLERGDGNPGDQVDGFWAPVNFKTSEFPQDGWMPQPWQIGSFLPRDDHNQPSR
jgi:hypothetical protein